MLILPRDVIMFKKMTGSLLLLSLFGRDAR